MRLTPAEDVDDVRRRVARLRRQAPRGRRRRSRDRTARAGASKRPLRGWRAPRSSRTWPTPWRIVDDLRKAVDLYREALAEAEGDPALEAEIHLNLAGLVMVTEERHRGLTHAELAVEAASRAGDAALRCRALANFGLLHFRGGRGIPRAQMEEALALERSLPQGPLTGEATSVLAFQLVWSGELDRARRLLEDRRAALSARDDPEEAERALAARASWSGEPATGSWRPATRPTRSRSARSSAASRRSRWRSCPPR